MSLSITDAADDDDGPLLVRGLAGHFRVVVVGGAGRLDEVFLTLELRKTRHGTSLADDR
jgi:hypothetical protein